MHKMGIMFVFGLFVVGVQTRPALAVKQFQDQFHKLYLGEEKKSKFAKKVLETKCWVCHQGKKKKNHNTYGIHLVKLLNRKKDAKNPEKIVVALKKVELLHTDPKDKKSPTYGEMIKDGKLPGGTLEQCKKEPKKEDGKKDGKKN